MVKVRTQMDQHGRLLIPATLRKELNYKPGDTFIVRVIENELRIMSLEKVISNIQEFMSEHINPGASSVEEFLRMKQEDFVNEQKKH